MGQWNKALYKNWYVVVSNPFGHCIKTQSPRETHFDLEVKIAIKEQWLILSLSKIPKVGRGIAKKEAKKKTKRGNSDVPRTKYKIIALFHIKLKKYFSNIVSS